jgi:hypothetical protein
MMTSRIWFTSAQKAELWERWKQGQSISSISRALDRRNKSGVQRIVSFHGGIAPSARRRAASALRLAEREEISRGIAAGLAIRAIARSLGRSPSTVCREVSRNGGAQAYRAIRADKHAWERALRAPSSVAWPAMDGYDGGWRTSWRCNGRRRNASDERQVQVYLSQRGSELHAKTGCLTETLLHRSGFTIPEMVDLNRKVQKLRDGMTRDTA